MTQRKKPNKEQRAKRRKDHADTFNLAFKMGFDVGFAEGQKRKLEDMANGQRETSVCKVETK